MGSARRFPFDVIYIFWRPPVSGHSAAKVCGVGRVTYVYAVTAGYFALVMGKYFTKTFLFVRKSIHIFVQSFIGINLIYP